MMSSTAKIHCILPVNGEYNIENMISLSTDEFAEQRGVLTRQHADWNFTEFSSKRDANRAFANVSHLKQSNMGLLNGDKTSYVNYVESLVKGEPHKDFLDKINSRLNEYDGIGLLTARGGSPVATMTGVCSFLRKHSYYRLANRIEEKLVFCISYDKFVEDNDIINHIASSTEDMKTVVMTKYYKEKFGYDLIDFYDDDVKNVNIVGKLDFVNAFLVE